VSLHFSGITREETVVWVEALETYANTNIYIYIYIYIYAHFFIYKEKNFIAHSSVS
jgi:hypothetical protein